jgi:hypothetical protein
VKFLSEHLPKKDSANTKEYLSRQGKPPTSRMVAGKRVCPQDTARIRAYIEDTANPRSNREIALLMGVSARTIERLRLNFQLFDAPYPPLSVKIGRPTTLNEAQQAVS